MIEFKISNDPDQQFSTVLGGKRCTIRLRYNVTNDRWSFDLSIDDLPVITGHRVVAGTDLLQAYRLGIGVLFAYGATATRESLFGGKTKLFHATESEVDAAVSA